jgi:hypothetical protein
LAGSVVLENGYCTVGLPHFLPRLTSIGGDFVLRRCRGSLCRNVFPRLTTVGGVLQLLDETVGAGMRLGSTGTTPLSLGALDVSNSALTAVPVFDDVIIASSGTVNIRDNPGLCQCHVDAFMTALGARWTGSSDISGNAGCSPCPAPACP